MKRFTTIFLLFIALSLNAQGNSFKKFYKAHKKEASISFNLPGFIARAFVDSDDFGEEELLIKKAKNFKVMIFDDVSSEVAEDFRKFAKSNKLKTLVRTKSGKDRAEIYFLEKNDNVKEIIIVAGSGKEELVFLGLKTNLTKDELSSIVAQMNDDKASH